MFGHLFANLKAENNNEPAAARRRYTRRDVDRCVTVINGKTYPVENWSLGGVCITSDEREFGVDDEHDITIKFKLRDDIMDVPHAGRVVRKGNNKVAFEFRPLTRDTRGRFQNVVDDYVASQFAASQSQLH